MSRRVKIGLGTSEESATGFIDAWHRAAEGDLHSEERLVFENLETLLRVLTPRRWQLLKALRTAGPSSIRSLARSLNRDYKNVHTDIKALRLVGLITPDDQGRMLVPWSSILAEIDLAA